MRVIVDTVVWSLALRRTQPDGEVRRHLKTLIENQRVVLLGPIRQEVLSGYSQPARFQRLRDKLGYFPNEPIFDEDYVQAAEFHNNCRIQGIQGSHTDFLICACAFRLGASIYTRDQDFQHFRAALPITLYPAAEDQKSDHPLAYKPA